MLRHLQDGPLRLSALEKRLGRDPQARVARLRRAGLVEVEQDIEAPGFRERRVAVLTEVALEPRGRAQAAVLERLRAAGGRARVAELVRDRPSLRGAVDRLAEKGALRIVEERDVRGPEGLPAREFLPVVPTPDQEAALGPLLEALAGGAFRPFLLHGVTGSGKTEVYFRAVEAALARGRGAIVLVPEIALTPMLVRAARARFGGTVSVLHSELSAGERHDQWWRIREGESRVVVGARSAVFAPVPDLGLVVVDEEHDGSYKQDESPRYHGRDVAVMRARLEACPVVLGSATPSVESHANALRGKYERLLLPHRIGPQGLARVEIVDRRAMLKAGGDPILGPTLRDALAARLARREQSLVLLNRRGYATSLLCRECGQEAMCPNCSVSLTLHHGGRSALCHYCGHEAKAPDRVPVVPRRLPAPQRLRHRARGRGGAGGPARRAGRAARPRPCQPARRPRPDAGGVREGRDRRARRHADDREGARLPARDARRRRGRRRGPGDPGLPVRGAHVPAPDAGGRPGRARRDRGRGHPAEPHARPLRPRPRVRAGLRLVLRAGDGVPADHGLPAGGRPRERHRARGGGAEGGGGGGRPGPRAAGLGRRAIPRARARPRPARPPAQRAPLPDRPQGAAPGDARRRARPPSWRATGRSGGRASPSTWIP